MIVKKTASLFQTSCILGGLSANADKNKVRALSRFGEYAGIAFQIQDDYLDNFGGASFGKKIGGDILEGKRTFFLVRAVEQSPRNALVKKLVRRSVTHNEVPAVIRLFEQLGLSAEAEKLVARYTNKAVAALSPFPDSTAKQYITRFVLELIGRTT